MSDLVERLRRYGQGSEEIGYYELLSLACLAAIEITQERALADDAAHIFARLTNADEATEWFLKSELAAIEQWHTRYRKARGQ